MCLCVCLFAISSETANPKELKFWGVISFGLKIFWLRNKHPFAGKPKKCKQYWQKPTFNWYVLSPLMLIKLRVAKITGSWIVECAKLDLVKVSSTLRSWCYQSQYNFVVAQPPISLYILHIKWKIYIADWLSCSKNIYVSFEYFLVLDP